jgi:hypothetical protein
MTFARGLMNKIKARSNSENLSGNKLQTIKLSPIQWENTVLTSIIWTILIAISPMTLLIIESTIISMSYHENFSWSYAVSDLRDPIFLSVTVILFVGAFVFSRIWYPNIRKGFQSLLDNKIIDIENGDTQERYSSFLTRYQEELHSKKRYFTVFGVIVFLLGVSMIVIRGRSGFWDFSWVDNPTYKMLLIIHRLTRWVLSAFIWGYFAGLALRSLVITHKAIRHLIENFELEPKPYHSDRVGGFGQFGEMIGFIGLLLIVALIPLGILGIPRTASVVRSINCGADIRLAAKSEKWLGRSDVIDCVYYLNYAFDNTDITRKEINDDFKYYESNGNTLQDIIEAYDGYIAEEMSDYENDEFDVLVFNINSMYIFLSLGVIIIGVLFYPLVITPFMRLHQVMVRHKHDIQRLLDQQAATLYGNLSVEITYGKWENVAHTRGELQKISETIQDVSNFPTWPINLQRMVQIFLSPTLVTSLLTYLLSRVDIIFSGDLISIIGDSVEKLLSH